MRGVADVSPESGGASVVVRHERSHPPNAFCSETRVSLINQATSDPATAVVGENGKPVHVPSPAVPASYEHSNDTAVLLSNEKAVARMCDQAAMLSGSSSVLAAELLAVVQTASTPGMSPGRAGRM